MHTTTKTIPLKLDNITNSLYLLNKDFLILDIETTGFSRQNEIIYMIGCIYKRDEGYEYCNMFASKPSKESELIQSFFNMAKNFQCIIHFNGDQFDIPFLLARAAKYNITDTISSLKSIDIYQLLRPFRKCLDFPDLKLDTIQHYLGYKRKDTSNGGDLIQIYHHYSKNPYTPYYQLLLLHNKEDVEGMIYLLPIIHVSDLINTIISTQDIKVLNIIQDKNQTTILYQLAKKVLMDFKLSAKERGQVTLRANSDKCELILPLYEGQKKFFFENYQDYVYLPEKDQVIHKSIASFIPSDQKERVNKGNCYVSQTGVFMELWWPDSSPGQKMRLFRDHLRAKENYILSNSELDKDFYKKQLAGFLMHCKGL